VESVAIVHPLTIAPDGKSTGEINDGKFTPKHNMMPLTIASYYV
jgi:hypothetical protein